MRQELTWLGEEFDALVIGFLATERRGSRSHACVDGGDGIGVTLCEDGIGAFDNMACANLLNRDGFT